MIELRHGEVSVDGNVLHHVSAGHGEPVVLVHGFPEFWYSWREQIPALAAAGFRPVAVDLRGYNLSHRPREIDAYRLEVIASELAGYIEVLGGGRVHLVGHDWGAAACWLVAMRRRELLRTLTIINIPHPGAFRAIRDRTRQMLRFSYQLAFQPRFAESLLRARRFLLLRKMMKAGSQRPQGITEEVLAEYERAWSQPGALRGMLNYYRAIRRARGVIASSTSGRVAVPALLIFGDREPVILRETIEASARFVDDLRIETLVGAGHFAHQDQPEAVNRMVIDFLRG